MTITIEQIRAARALLGWTQDELAGRAGVTRKTIANIETEAKVPHRSTVDRLIEVFSESGVSFENSDDRIGVYIRK